jgi:hypothetical protein
MGMKTQIASAALALMLGCSAIATMGCAVRSKKDAQESKAAVAAAHQAPIPQQAVTAPEGVRLRAIAVSATVQVAAIDVSSALLRSVAKRNACAAKLSMRQLTAGGQLSHRQFLRRAYAA